MRGRNTSKQNVRWRGNITAIDEHRKAVEQAANRTRKRLIDEQAERERKRAKKRPERLPFVGTYREYLDSPQWRAKRRWALRRLGRKCSVCGSRDRLHVHHKTYKNLFREKLEDLQILCAGCHANTHEDKGAVDPMTAEFLSLVKSF